MLRARNISFYRMMEAGYLSPEAYRELKPKRTQDQLSVEECCTYSDNVRMELERLFNDDRIAESLYYLEKIEQDVNQDYDLVEKQLDEALRKASDKARRFVNEIGKKLFLTDYMFLADSAFDSYYHIGSDNITDINKLRTEFIAIYTKSGKNRMPQHSKETEGTMQGNFNKVEQRKSVSLSYNIDSEDENNMVSEPFAMAEITSGEGFSYNDVFDLDINFLKSLSLVYKQYVLFLYGLDYDQFQIFEDYMLRITSNISIRLSNIVKILGVRNFYVNYLFADETKLLKVHKLGRKCVYEINTIKDEIINFVASRFNSTETDGIQITAIELHEDKHLISLYELIGSRQYSILQLELEKLKKSLSARARNVLDTYKGDFIEDYVHNNNDIKKIKKIGKKTEYEFAYIIDILRDMVKSMSDVDVSDEIVAKRKKQLFYGDYYDEYCESIFESEGHLPMFYVLERFITKNMRERSLKIMNMYSPIFKGQKLRTLDEIAAEVNLTRERVRQICSKYNNILRSVDPSDLEKDKFNYSKLLSQKEDWQYITGKTSAYEIIGIDDIKDITIDENCNLTDEFILLIIQLINDNFVIMGKDPLPQPSRNNGVWRNTYLIKKVYSDVFDFDEMVNLVHEYEENNTESLTLSIDELLTDTFFTAWKEYDYQIVESLQNIVSQLLINELDIVPDMDFRFTLTGKKQIQPEDVIYEILSAEGEPTDIDVLFSKFEEILPGRYQSSKSLRPIINRDSRLTIVRMNNLVVLSEWNHVQTGSIRELIVSFLAKHKKPQHIKDIYGHISQLRETTEHSIYTTMCTGDQFVKFNGGYFGLADKKYDNWIDYTETERYARKLIAEFEQFLNDNQHFPFSSTSNKEEQNLYQCWSRLRRKKDLPEEIQKEIQRIEDTYLMLPRNKTDFHWYSLYLEYRKFFVTQGRKPSEANASEAELVQWFNKNFNDLIEGNQPYIREKLFTNLCKIL